MYIVPVQYVHVHCTVITCSLNFGLLQVCTHLESSMWRVPFFEGCVITKSFIVFCFCTRPRFETCCGSTSADSCSSSDLHAGARRAPDRTVRLVRGAAAFVHWSGAADRPSEALRDDRRPLSESSSPRVDGGQACVS